MPELPFLTQYPKLRARSRFDLLASEIWSSRLEKFECPDFDNVFVESNAVVVDQLGVAVTTSTDYRAWKYQPDSFSIFIFLGGGGSIEVKGRSRDVGKGDTLVVPPGRYLSTPKNGCTAAYLSVPATPLAPRNRLASIPPLLMRESCSLGRTALTLLHELSNLPAPPSPRLAGAWASLISAQVSQALYDAEALEPEHEASLRQVKQAEDFIAARLDEVLTVDAIARKLGISSRSLQLAFRRHRAMSPSDYIAKERLAKIRMRLLNPQGTETVTSIALDTGITSLGRFAASYHALYGERPSETLARAMRRR